MGESARRYLYSCFYLPPDIALGGLADAEDETMAEERECQNCFHTGELNIHGRCENCDSDAVISLARIRISHEHEHTDQHVKIPSDASKDLS